MIEDLAKATGRPVSRETYEQIRHYGDLLREENGRQNLISAGTVDDIWSRHIIDSAQLVRFESHPAGSWVDIGSGAGLPGIVIACLVSGPVTLVEPRRLRADFLRQVVEELGLRAAVEPIKAEKVTGKFDIITARAVANLSRFVGLAHHLSTKNSVWVLPKGRNAESELAEFKRAWQGVFHVEPSVTDADSRIIVATELRKR
jgi:16S rRNA (guanine527-N7)-methyltransferase